MQVFLIVVLDFRPLIACPGGFEPLDYPICILQTIKGTSRFKYNLVTFSQNDTGQAKIK